MKQQLTDIECSNSSCIPCNKGRIIGQKPPLKPQDNWSIRVLLRMRKRYRDLALFNLAIDSKLRACDLVKLRTSDIVHGESVLARASIIQQKTGQPVRFEITDQTCAAVQQWITAANLWVILGYSQVGHDLRLISRHASMHGLSKLESR